MKDNEYIFVDKCVFFPEHGILTIGDLHVGYEHSLRKKGFLIPESQVRETIQNLEKIISEIKSRNYKLKKIVFLGDVKHFFNYEWKEKHEFNKILGFLREYVKDKNVIIIKGNHDTFEFHERKMKDFHIEGEIAFLHGHKSFPEVFDKKIKTIVMGHTHPSVTISDKQKIKRERYKCFLVGKFRKKELIIVPSFIGIHEGTSVNDSKYYPEEDFSIISYKKIMNFRAFVVDENGVVLDFGKEKNL